jgi:hypothetical protein
MPRLSPAPIDRRGARNAAHAELSDAINKVAAYAVNAWSIGLNCHKNALNKLLMDIAHQTMGLSHSSVSVA